MASSFWGDVTFNHRGTRWVIKRASPLERGEAEMRSNLLGMGLLVNEWCHDSLIWPEMLALYEDLVGSMSRPPTSDTIHHAIRVLSAAFERGDLVAFEQSALEKKSRPTEEGVHGKKSESEPPPPPPPPRRRVELPKTLHNFAIRFVDELGAPISGVAAEGLASVAGWYA